MSRHGSLRLLNPGLDTLGTLPVNCAGHMKNLLDTKTTTRHRTGRREFPHGKNARRAYVPRAQEACWATPAIASASPASQPASSTAGGRPTSSPNCRLALRSATNRAVSEE